MSSIKLYAIYCSTELFNVFNVDGKIKSRIGDSNVRVEMPYTSRSVRTLPVTIFILVVVFISLFHQVTDQILKL